MSAAGDKQITRTGRLQPGRLRRHPRATLIAAALALVLIAVLCIGATTLACGSGRMATRMYDLASAAGLTPTHPLSTAPSAAHRGTTIIAENARQGTTGWLITEANAATVEIQGYASATSVSPGQTLTFYVSTQQAGTAYTVEYYRLGWYGGAGARLLQTRHEVGQAQGYYDWARKTLVGCSSCVMDAQTHRLEARWQPSFQLTVPAEWVSGLYVAKLIGSGGKQTYVSFEVRGDAHSTYLAVIPDNTTEAYNDWGGYSLYHGPNDALTTRATKVSFDRPALGWRFGYGQGLSYVVDAIRWMERQGYDVSYISSVDLHEHPTQVLDHQAFVSLGHDEYWSKEMRDGVEHARDAGVNLAFFGANPSYWQIRYEPDGQGRPDRTIVCYKDAALDPLRGVDDTRLTIMWDDAPVSRPVSALVGLAYGGYVVPPQGFAWHLSANAPSDLLAGTGLVAGRSYGCNLVGYEWDTDTGVGGSPPNLHVLSTSPITSPHDGTTTSNSAYFITRTGAFIFASGSIYWSYALDDLRVPDVPHVTPTSPCMGAGQSAAVPGIQRMMEHVMDQLAVRGHQYDGLCPTWVR